MITNIISVPLLRCYCLFHFIRNVKNVSCQPYTPTGRCKDVLLMYNNPWPVKVVVNTSRAPNISFYQKTADKFFEVLTLLKPHRKCLEILQPFICHWVFSTCDPAFKASVQQHICRRGCETLSTFLCSEVWRRVTEQIGNLNFMVLNPPGCNNLEYVNAGDAPSCIDPTDGGTYVTYVM